MVTQDFEIAGNLSLSELTKAVRGAEVRGLAFKESIISHGNSVLVNLATFELLPPGKVPKAITFVASSQAVLDGKAQIWSGPMLVKSKNTTVKACR